MGKYRANLAELFLIFKTLGIFITWRGQRIMVGGGCKKYVSHCYREIPLPPSQIIRDIRGMNSQPWFVQ